MLHCFFCSDASRARLLQENAQLLSSAKNQIYFPAFFLALWVGIILLHVYTALCLRMYVCSEGLLRVFGPKVMAIRWCEVAQVRFWLADGRKYT